jgi:hypothetical protein
MSDEVPCVCYGAKSTTDVRGSIPDQLKDGREAIEREGGRFVAAEFSDEGKSGWSGNRGDGLAAAKERAAELAAEHGRCELWVQHSDRLARGDGLKADHLGEIFFAMRRVGVKLRSVQDDSNMEDAIRVVLIGERNNEDSTRKSGSVKSGMDRSRRRGDAGWLFRGIKPDGWMCVRTIGADGKVHREAIKDPERVEIWDLVWSMAKNGASVHAIQLELSTHGHKTAPVKEGHEPRSFDVHRIDHALRNPIYAGLVSHRPVLTDANGEAVLSKTRKPLRGPAQVVGEGDWPRYVDPEDFYRIQRERAARGNATQRRPGRPPVGYLLVNLAVCGECGRRLQAQTYRKHRRDGTVARRYHCPAHHEFADGSPEYCSAKPYDAADADRLVLSGLDSLLSDAEQLRAQLGAGRRAERARLEREVRTAEEDAATAERVVEKAMVRYEAALEADDDERAEIEMAVVRRKRREAESSWKLVEASRKALSMPVEDDDADVLERIWESLSGRIADAAGDVAKLNVVLRETFERFKLVRYEYTGLRVVPVMSAEALARMMRTPPAFRDGAISAIYLDESGEQVAYDGIHLTKGLNPAFSSKNCHWRTWARSSRSAGTYSVPSPR